MSAELPKLLVTFNSYADTIPSAGPDQARDESGDVSLYAADDPEHLIEAVRRWNAHSVLTGFAIPTSMRNTAWAILRQHFAGVLGIGPRGPFMIGVNA